MRRIFLVFLLVMLTVLPVSASQLEAPTVPEAGQPYFPQNPESFSEGVADIARKAFSAIQPSLTHAAATCAKVMCVCILIGILRNFPETNAHVIDIAATAAVAALLLKESNTLIKLGVDTVTRLSDYGKLLLPVMTAALAAQGGVTASTALYTGTAVFDAVLCTIISGFIVPMVYVFLCLAVANGALGEELLSKLRDFIKWLMTWSLKIVLYVFMGYISITGVVSGTADASALKAAKITISGAVPVVGGILSDASEAILVSAGLVKNSVGVYGLLAVLAVWIGPFLQIGAQYIALKLTATVCNIVGGKQISGLIKDFSSAMGFLLAMTVAVCVLLMISTVAFMKGVN